MDYVKQNSGGRKWSKTCRYHLWVADWGREMGLNSRKSDLDQPGIWMDVVILFLFLVWRLKLGLYTHPPPPFFCNITVLFMAMSTMWLWHRDTATDWQYGADLEVYGTFVPDVVFCLISQAVIDDHLDFQQMLLSRAIYHWYSLSIYSANSWGLTVVGSNP